VDHLLGKIWALLRFKTRGQPSAPLPHEEIERFQRAMIEQLKVPREYLGYKEDCK
jgi:hypothetical protein